MKQKNIIDTLQGIAIGDAFGVGLEFKSRFWIAENVHFDKYMNEWNAGNNTIVPGAYSDDTEHTIGVVEALLSGQPFSEELLLEKFKLEYENDKKIKGFPRDGHGSIEKWYKGEMAIDQVRKIQSVREDPGNAPVMRAVPICFAPRTHVYPYSIINANCTHPNENARRASVLTVLTAWHFLRNEGEPGELIPFLLGHIADEEVKFLLENVDVLPKQSSLKEEDYLFLHGVQPLPYIKWDSNVYGMPCAVLKTALNVVYILKHNTNAFDALKSNILMGGDVDSLAAVCTGIAGGKYGLDSIPKFMFEKTEGLDRLETLGKRVYMKFFM